MAIFHFRIKLFLHEKGDIDSMYRRNSLACKKKITKRIKRKKEYKGTCIRMHRFLFDFAFTIHDNYYRICRQMEKLWRFFF